MDESEEWWKELYWQKKLWDVQKVNGEILRNKFEGCGSEKESNHGYSLQNKPTNQLFGLRKSTNKNVHEIMSREQPDLSENLIIFEATKNIETSDWSQWKNFFSNGN
jgi:hypothetical protein